MFQLENINFPLKLSSSYENKLAKAISTRITLKALLYSYEKLENRKVLSFVEQIQSFFVRVRQKDLTLVNNISRKMNNEVLRPETEKNLPV